jgi:predicted RNA binding protein YcfA (HicA-like mRNA interferase family)
MGRKARLPEQRRGNPNNVSFEDLVKLLLWCGFECRHHGGSHYVYTREQMPHPLTVPRHKPVKKHWVMAAIERTEEFGDLEDD